MPLFQAFCCVILLVRDFYYLGLQVIDCTREVVDCVGTPPPNVIISCKCKRLQKYQYYAEEPPRVSSAKVITRNVTTTTTQYTPTPDDYDSEADRFNSSPVVTTLTSTTTTVNPPILPNVLQHHATIPVVVGIFAALFICCVTLVVCLCCRNRQRLSDEENPLNQTNMSNMSSSQTNNPTGEIPTID